MAAKMAPPPAAPGTVTTVPGAVPTAQCHSGAPGTGKASTVKVAVAGFHQWSQFLRRMSPAQAPPVWRLWPLPRSGRSLPIAVLGLLGAGVAGQPGC